MRRTVVLALIVALGCVSLVLVRGRDGDSPSSSPPHNALAEPSPGVVEIEQRHTRSIGPQIAGIPSRSSEAAPPEPPRTVEQPQTPAPAEQPRDVAFLLPTPTIDNTGGGGSKTPSRRTSDLGPASDLGTLVVVDAPDAEIPSTAEQHPPATAGTSQERIGGRSARSASSPVVRMVASATEVRVGESVSVSIEISGARDVGHVPFHVRFDPAVLRFDSGTEGVFMASDGANTAFLAAATGGGDVVVVGMSRLRSSHADGVSGGGELCVLGFTAVGPGPANFSFERAKVRDGTNTIVPSVFRQATIHVR